MSGVLAFAFNFLPYVGPLIITIANGALILPGDYMFV